MDCVIVSTELLNTEKRRHSVFKDDYKLDMWLELKKRWLVFGVLASVMLAVVAPRVGAPGGPLRTELLSYIPLSYIYYSAGRRAVRGAGQARVAGDARACALAAAHAHAVAPVLCAVAVTAFRDCGLDHRVIKGALLSSVGAPCAWLSLCVSRDARAAAFLLTGSYLTSLLAAPASLYILCGRATLPALGPSISSALHVLPPFVIGALYSHSQNYKHTQNIHTQDNTENADQSPNQTRTTWSTQNANASKNNTQTATSTCNNKQIAHSQSTQDEYNCSQCMQHTAQCVCDISQGACSCDFPQGAACAFVARLSALALVYVDCCERLREAEGSLQVADVLGTLVLALFYLTLSAAFCRVYARCGLRPAQARALALCAVPKALHAGWESSTACVPGGLARLPAVFLAPAQALLLAAIADYDDTGLPCRCPRLPH